MATIITNIEQISKYPVGIRLYEPTATILKSYYFAGINPKDKNSIMLISDGDVNKISGRYLANGLNEFYPNLDEAYKKCYELAMENAEIFKSFIPQ